MPITTLAEIKLNLNITDTTYDTRITQLRPGTEKELFTTCRRYFNDKPRIGYISNSIAFVDGSPPTITDTNSWFVESDFKAGYDILIENSKYNSFKIFTLGTVAAGTLTLTETDYTLTAEATDWNIKISIINYPMDLPKIIADMIWETMKQKSSGGISSESYMGQSVNYDTRSKYSRNLQDRINQHTLLGIA